MAGRVRDLAALLRGAAAAGPGARAADRGADRDDGADDQTMAADLDADHGATAARAQDQQQQQQRQRQRQQRQEKPPPLALVIAHGPDTLQADFTEHLWNLAGLRVCVDGAANALHEACVSAEKLAAARFTPNLIVGDLDSVDKKTREFFEARGTRVVHTPDQDKHDLEKALLVVAEAQDEAMLDARYRVIVLGATGGRLDQEFANLSMLFKFDKTFEEIVLLSDLSLGLLLLPGKHTIIRPDDIIGPVCGLAPVAGPAHVTTSGLRWNLQNKELALGGLVSSSNEMSGSTAIVETDAPLIWSSLPLEVFDDEEFSVSTD